MISQIHPSFCVSGIQPWRPLLCTWKTDIRRTKGRFPYLAEFVQDVGNFGLVGIVILLKFHYIYYILYC